jgi:8-oxo-dGTP pyrophosphatase MutT (NUDIX family)
VETRTPAPVYTAAHAFPVSVKGVAVQGGKVLLLENERSEWELPGGKLELGEDPADCMVREIGEESGWTVMAGPLLDCWQYHIREGSDVVIVTYGCHVLSHDPPVVSNEHKRAGLFAPGELQELVMPDGYKRSVAAWFARLDGQAVS